MYEAEQKGSSQLNIKQNFYHLFCIQTVSTGPPGIMIGKQLSEQYGGGIAICSIFVGSLILWIIGLAIISMVYQERTNAIENIRGYIGKWGSLLFSLILVSAFLNWYVVEIKTPLTGLDTLFQFRSFWNENLLIRFGAVLGILAALLAIGGIRLLQRLTTIGFPFLIFYFSYIILNSDYSLFTEWKWGLSFSGILLAILINLPGVINLPTFFRYSQSRADSFLALTFMVIFYTIFESSSIWMDFSSNLESISKDISTSSSYFVVLTSIFFILTSTCSNLLNIYLASACYETFIPRFQGTKGHAIIGLLGTAAYTFIQISSPIVFLVNLLNAYIGVLGIALLIAVLCRIVVQHRPRKFEKTINAVSWVVGCVVATVFQWQSPEDGVRPLLLGIGASALFFLCVFFVEETLWAVKKISSQKKADKIMES